MKKVIAFLLCLFIILAVFLSGCNGNTRDVPPVSPPQFTQEEENNLLLNGNILTRILVLCSNTNSTIEQPEFHYVQLLARCIVEEEPGFKYYHIAQENTGSGAAMPTELCSTVIKQITGRTADITGSPLTQTEDGMTHIITETGWGLVSYGCGDYIYSSLNDYKTQVVTTFELLVPDDSSGDPGHKSAGRYKAYYNIVTEENHGTYLQFDRFEKE